MKESWSDQVSAASLGVGDPLSRGGQDDLEEKGDDSDTADLLTELETLKRKS